MKGQLASSLGAPALCLELQSGESVVAHGAVLLGYSGNLICESDVGGIWAERVSRRPRLRLHAAGDCRFWLAPESAGAILAAPEEEMLVKRESAFLSLSARLPLGPFKEGPLSGFISADGELPYLAADGVEELALSGRLWVPRTALLAFQKHLDVRHVAGALDGFAVSGVGRLWLERRPFILMKNAINRAFPSR